MADFQADGRPEWYTPLKAPAVQVVDLTTTTLDSNADGPDKQLEHDALSPTKDDDESSDAWETETETEGSDGQQESDHVLSIFEEMIDGIDDEGELSDQDFDIFTPEEAKHLRRRLRLVGEDRFIKETIDAKLVTAKKMCTAFGVRPPFFLEGSPDEAYYALLSVCISRELQKRVKLPQWNTVEDAVALLKRSSNVVVLTGAGISTSLGIPDFRSKETGLYAQLEHLGLSDPQEVFDIRLFREDPSIFYSVAKDILPSSKKYTPTHAFIRLLQDKHKLLTNFTQNIDNLEEWAGIEKEKLVQCHGSFATATCIECNYKVECKAIYKDLKAGKVARCDRCIERIQKVRPGIKRKRSSDSSSTKPRKKKASYEDSTDDEDDDIAVAGVMKPDITFFGEDLPARFHDRLINHDRELVDLVVVIGTSLKVAPVSEVVGVIPAEVPQIYISRESCNHVDFDIELLGDCDAVVTELCRRAEWDLEHEMVSEAAIDVQLKEGYESRFEIKSRPAPPLTGRLDTKNTTMEGAMEEKKGTMMEEETAILEEVDEHEAKVEEKEGTKDVMKPEAKIAEKVTEVRRQSLIEMDETIAGKETTTMLHEV